jgi:hypothetical protein
LSGYRFCVVRINLAEIQRFFLETSSEWEGDMSKYFRFLAIFLRGVLHGREGKRRPFSQISGLSNIRDSFPATPCEQA